MKITEWEACFGCGACTQICPKRAITMEPDQEGFLRPMIHEDLCVACGQCQKSCPAESLGLLTGEKKAYALKHNAEAVRNMCSSGGAFIALSDLVLSWGGVVYGVIYDEDFQAVHTRAETPEGRQKMCGSKYVQSDTGTTFCQALEDLKRGRWVLFSGTSCQIDGLTHYLRCKGADTEKLVTCSLICHGAPSPKMWQEHLDNICRKRNKKIAYYANRSKVRGWHEHNEHITYTDGSQEYYSKLSQNHKDLFYGHYIIRPSCFMCPYAADPSAADITVADFWGVQYLMPELDDNRGVSLVLTNSEKGEKLLHSCLGTSLWKVDRETALKQNHCKPCKPNPKRTQFWSDYQSRGYEYICAKYANDSFKGRLYYGGKKRLRALLVKLKILHV